MARRRTKAPIDLTPMLVEVYAHARFRCSNPACGQWIVLDSSHLIYVDDSAGEFAENLLALCPDCYDRRISPIKRAAWKSVQLAEDSPFDFDAFMFLAFLDAIGEPLVVSADRLVELRRVIVSGAVQATREAGSTSWVLELTVSGQLQLEAWRQGRTVGVEDSITRDLPRRS